MSNTIQESIKELVAINARVIVPANEFDLNNDGRLLIPFIRGIKIGFINRQGKIVVEPMYDAIYGDVYNDNDFIQVGMSCSYAYERKNDRPYVYNRINWGMLNCKGECVLEPKYSKIILGYNTFIVKNAYGYENDGTYSLLESNGETIIPFGIYNEIEPFENGLARCIINKYENNNTFTQYGIINEKGEIVLKCNKRYIPIFHGKYKATNFVKVKDLIKHENVSAFIKYIDNSRPWEDILFEIDEEIKKKEKGNSNHRYDFEYIEDNYFDIDSCYDYEGNFDYDSYDDAIIDGEYVEDD